MRVLLVHAFYRLPGGEDRYVRAQQRVLSDRHDVRLFEADNAELRSSTATAATMLVGRRSRQRLMEAVEQFAPNVIHVHNSYPALGPAPFLVAQKLQVPLVMTLHNYRLRCPNGYFFTHDGICTRCEQGNYVHAIRHNCLQSRSQSTVYALGLWLHRFGFRLEETVNAFIAPSRFVAARLSQAGIPEHKLVRVPNFTARNEAPRKPRTHGIFVGRLSREKGVDVLLEALKIAQDPPFKIVGAGPLERDLRRGAVERGLRNTVFLGRLNPLQVQGELRAARYLVIPSIWYENAPLVALEALAAGCPLLVSDVGGLPELVEQGAGHAFAAGDASALSVLIRDLVRGDREVDDLSTRAEGTFHESFTPQRHLERLDQVYTTVITNR